MNWRKVKMTDTKNLTKIIYRSQEAQKELMINNTKGKIIQKKIDRLMSISFIFLISGFIASLFMGIFTWGYTDKYLEKLNSPISCLIAIFLGMLVFLVIVSFCLFILGKIDKKIDKYNEKIKLSDNTRYYNFLNKYKPDEFDIVKNIKIEGNKIIVLEKNPLYNKFKFKDEYTVVQTDRCFDAIDLIEKKIYLKHELNTRICAECRQPC